MKVEDVVSVNIVMVGFPPFDMQENFDAFRRAVGPDLQIAGAGLIANPLPGIPEPGIQLTLNRDRISIDLSPSRSIINRDYPSREDLGRLAEVIGKFVTYSTYDYSNPQTFGINIRLIFDPESETSAFEYLASRLFDVEPLGRTDWRFIGGSGRLIFDEDGRRWTISLEPRFSDFEETRVFVDSNLHLYGQPLPEETEIGDLLEEVWDEVHKLVGRLDRMEVRRG